MEFNIREIKELESGGEELIVDMDEKTKMYLINYAIIDLFTKGLADIKTLHEEEYKHED
jgi:hypothetical protein